MQKIDRKFRLARIWSNDELKKYAHLFEGNVINVSAGENIDKQGKTYDQYFINASKFSLSNYSPGSFRGYEGRPNEHLIDLEKPLMEELKRQFDVVFNHTTLEHVFDVFTAFKNLCDLSNDVVILVVPFAQEQHETTDFFDYWRLTPTCIRELFKRNGFSVIYESSNNDFNACTYLFSIGSRKPEKWVEKFPLIEPERNAANWIGSNPEKKSFFGKILNKL
ncbi:hypothetical protein [Cognataquiflexum rubidum]|uniref:hypothetical protein n=1 Tax=Cognataquiflexum rubidum TaxID=2922273 RepID=UPI001F135245|nr:hypothetical protein [Cognataquiflexum rubidum]MCH6236512.1 hypothetical protein [Cognataquiflexum rubidum]